MSSGFFVTASEEQKAESAEALNTFKNLETDDKADFAKKFLDSRKTKQFGWMRQYRENMTVDKEVEGKYNESYMTRSYLEPSRLKAALDIFIVGNFDLI